MSNMILRIGRRLTVNVRDYGHASELYAAERHQSGEGGSTFPEGCIMQGGKKVAKVSYNAKVWHPRPWQPGDVPLYNPYVDGWK